MGHRVAPEAGLAIEVRQIGESARRKEGMANILDGPLDATFLGAPKGPARLSGEVIMAAEFEQAWVKVNGVAKAFADDGFEIVIQNGSGRATPLTKGVHMAQQKVLDCLVEKELEIERPAVREREHKAGETTLGAADGDRAETGPISLCLFAGQSCQAQEGFVFCWPQSSHHPPQLHHTAGVTAVAQHLIETGGAQAGMLLKGLLNEVKVRISEGGTRRRTPLEALSLQGGAHRVRMHPQLGGNGADPPMLGVKQAANLRSLFGRDHGLSLRPSIALKKLTRAATEPANHRAVVGPRQRKVSGPQVERTHAAGWSHA